MEKWKDEIINSLEGIQRAEPSVAVFHKIQKEINNDESTNNKQWIAVAASVVLVLCINVFFISNYNSQPITEVQESSYPSIISNFNLYE